MSEASRPCVVKMYVCVCVCMYVIWVHDRPNDGDNGLWKCWSVEKQSKKYVQDIGLSQELNVILSRPRLQE